MTGDTVKMLSNGSIYKIRLNGLDCPELAQAYGIEAREFTKSLLLGKEVKAVRRDRDKYGRLVCDLYLNGNYINEEIVSMGYAYVYPQYSTEKMYLDELQAKAAKLGLW